MAVPVNVVLSILWNEVLRAWFVGSHVVALPVGGCLLENVTHIER